jgi:hypothetical protein
LFPLLLSQKAPWALANNGLCVTVEIVSSKLVASDAEPGIMDYLLKAAELQLPVLHVNNYWMLGSW